MARKINNKGRHWYGDLKATLVSMNSMKCDSCVNITFLKKMLWYKPHTYTSILPTFFFYTVVKLVKFVGLKIIISIFNLKINKYLIIEPSNRISLNNL